MAACVSLLTWMHTSLKPFTLPSCSLYLLLGPSVFLVFAEATILPCPISEYHDLFQRELRRL